MECLRWGRCFPAFLSINVLVWSFFNVPARNQGLNGWGVPGVNPRRVREDPGACIPSGSLEGTALFYQEETFDGTVFSIPTRSSAQTNASAVSAPEIGKAVLQIQAHQHPSPGS